MKVQVQLFASLRKYAPDESASGPFDMTLQEDATVAEVLDRLGVPEETVKLVFVNGVHAGGETRLGHGDRMGVFPPVAGG
jgi:sulfur-carrier protein